MEGFTSSYNAAKSVLVITRRVASLDKAMALIGMVKTLSGEGKVVDLLILTTLTGKIQNLFDRYRISYLTELSPSNYEVWIDYAKSGIEKVVYDIDEDVQKLKFTIFPGSRDFNFDNIEYIEGGSRYDLTIVLGVDDFKALGELYDKNEYLFRDNFTVAFKKGSEKISDCDINLLKEDSYSEKVYEFFKSSNLQLNKEASEILLNGIVNRRRFLEGNASSNSWDLVSSMISEGADIFSVVDDVYFSKTKENLDLQLKVMHNVKIDRENGIVWSLVDYKTMNSCGISKSNLDVRGRIPFNLSKEYIFAFVFYELKPGNMKMVVESNSPVKYPANSIAGVWGGKGGASHAEANVKNTSSEKLEKDMYAVLKDLFKFKFEGLGDSKLVVEREKFADIKGKRLTKSAKNSKNKG